MPDLEEVNEIVETHHEPGTPELPEGKQPAIKEPPDKPDTPTPEEKETPSLPEGFTPEKWEELTELEKQYIDLQPVLEEYGAASLDDLKEILSQRQEEEDETDKPAAPAPDASPDAFMASLKPEEQAWVNNFKKHIFSDPALKDLGGVKALRGHVSDALFDNWMLAAKVEHLSQALAGIEGMKLPKFEHNSKEVRKILETYGKTMIPRALRAGKNPASEAIAFLLAQKSAQKPAVETRQPSGIEKGLRTERPGGVLTAATKPPFPMLPDGSDFDWEKMDSETLSKALAWLAKQRDQQAA